MQLKTQRRRGTEKLLVSGVGGHFLGGGLEGSEYSPRARARHGAAIEVVDTFQGLSVGELIDKASAITE